MDFNIRETKGILIISLSGDMIGGPDATQLSELLHEKVNAGETRIIVDLRNVQYMNSSGLGILIGGVSAVRSHGGDLRLLHLNEKPRKVLEITQLDRIFKIFSSEAEAVESFQNR
ncbi:STAS domain-containing protein [bacterium]|nr:STAS domain-containing protein [bacterium]